MVPEQGISQMKPNSDEVRRNSRELAKRKLRATWARRRKTTAFVDAACELRFEVIWLGQTDVPIDHDRADARGIHARRSGDRNVRRRPSRGDRRKMRDPHSQA